jgi:hypothetical protein
MITVTELRQKRKTTKCEWCKKREAEQRHHCLIHDSKRFHEELTVEENLMLACSYCHTGVCVLNGYDIRVWFWGKQCERYGIDHMLDWVDSLPDKLRYSGRLDFMNECNAMEATKLPRVASLHSAGSNPIIAR